MDGRLATPVLNGRRITTLRRDRHLRAEELARAAGLSVAQVYRLEAGNRPNTAAVTLARIAVALDTTVEYLLDLTDDRGPAEVTG